MLYNAFTSLKVSAFVVLLALTATVTSAWAFSITSSPQASVAFRMPLTITSKHINHVTAADTTTLTSLRMSDSGGGGGGGGNTARSKSKKRGLSTIVIDKTETKMEEDKKKEEMWRLVLHNDEVNTFQHVQRALCTVVSTLDRKRAFDICMETHGIGKATITKTWRQKAEQYCLNLQRQGLTVSIAPDKAFEGGGADGKGPDMS